MWNWLLCLLGLKFLNKSYEQKSIMDEGTSNYVNEAKSREIKLKDCIVEDFHLGRMSRDALKALEEVENFKTAEQGLPGSHTEWRPLEEILEKIVKELKELEKIEELTAGENKQGFVHTTDMEPQHTRGENAVTEVLKLKAYQPKSEIEDAAPLEEMMLPYSEKAQVVAEVQTGDVGMKGMTICEDLMEAKFQLRTIGARSVQRGSAEVVENWNVQLGRCLMDQYSSGKTSRDCLKLLEVDEEFQSGGHRVYGEQTEWRPDKEFPEQIATTSKEEELAGQDVSK